MIVGTAGHIDHGKTTLVRALTGIETDRLKEEKARGISIELGYAYVPLNNGDVLGFVDVPGHERLVHTMAAGACGIDFALLVIAADDGIMPQTREHVAILQLFGVLQGAVVLTKIDRVDELRANAVEAEAKEFLAATAFRDSPVFRVNAPADGDVGIRQLKEHLEAVATAGAAAGTAAPDARLFRLAVDRVFTLAGHGTVVAGTLFSGTVRTGDQVVVFPSNIPVRVRSIHSQNRPAEAGRSGERCALTLSGIEKSAVKRGDWLADSRLLSPTLRIDTRLELLTGADTGAVLKAWAPVHFHHGATHATAHVVSIESSVMQAGQPYHAQIVFDSPICALPGDRFIVRDAQAIHTLGGGIVLDPFAPSRRRRSPERIRYLCALERMIAGEGLAPLLLEAPHGIKHSELIRLTGRILQHLPEDAITVDGVRGQYILLSSAWRALSEQAVRALQEFHLESPDERGPDVGRLRRIAVPDLPHDLWLSLISALTSDGTILRSGPWVYSPGHSVTLSGDEQTLARKLQPLVAAGRFNPPWVRDLANTVHEPEDTVRRVLHKLVTQGMVYQVVHDLFYDRQCIDELATVATNIAQRHGSVEAAQYRDAVGLGRKRAIQILEFFDRVGHTRRIRDSRILRSNSAWPDRSVRAG